MTQAELRKKLEEEEEEFAKMGLKKYSLTEFLYELRLEVKNDNTNSK